MGIGGLIDAIDKDEVFEVLAAIIREKPLPELCSTLSSSGERKRETSNGVRAADGVGDEGVDDLQGGVLLVDQPLVLGLGGQVLLCKGLLLRQGSQEGA